jgi:c-di-GMP-binding flagellar brake protein YcgR
MMTAMGLWFYQRYRQHERNEIRLQHEKRLMKKHLAALKLPKADTDYLEKLILKYSKQAPMHAVTSREPFNHLVNEEMISILKRGNLEEFESKGVLLRDLRSALRLDQVPIGQRIHSTREMHPGLWVYVTPVDSDKVDWIRMMVQEVDEAYFYISADRKGPMPAFHENEHVRCRFWLDEDGRYIFESEIIKRPGTHAQWRLDHTAKLKRTQNRAHFRIRYNSDTSIGLITAPADLDSETLNKRKPVSKIRGKITSLSAGGLALVMPQPVSDRMVLRVDLPVDGGETISTHLKIISSSTISGGRVLLRGCFVGINDTDRDRLSKFILHKQQQAILVENEKLE